MAKIGPGRNSKRAGLLVEDAHAGDVAGQQVGGELDAREAAVDRAGQRLGEERLADARVVLDDDVAAGQQRDDAGLDDLVLAEDDRRDVGGDAVRPVRDLLQLALAEGRLAACLHFHVAPQSCALDLPSQEYPTLPCGTRSVGMTFEPSAQQRRMAGVWTRVKSGWSSGRINGFGRAGRVRRTGPPALCLRPPSSLLVHQAGELGAPGFGALELAVAQRAGLTLHDESLRLRKPGVAARLELLRDRRRALPERALGLRVERRRPAVPEGSRSSHVRSSGCERSGAGPFGGLFAMPSRIFCEESLKPSTGPPATMRSAPAIASGVASAVERARASAPMPAATARATAAVFPQSDS